jgi:hypothetical protein
MQGLFEADLASESFVTAMRMWPTLAEGWVSWGTFLLQQYAQLGRDPAQAQKLEGGLISYFQVAFPLLLHSWSVLVDIPHPDGESSTQRTCEGLFLEDDIGCARCPRELVKLVCDPHLLFVVSSRHACHMRLHRWESVKHILFCGRCTALTARIKTS